MVTTERRRAPRTKLREIVYIGMGTDNGGVVLDISDGGLSFHAVTSIDQTEPIQFSLSVQGRGRIQGTAEVTWNSAAAKCAGLRFTHLPEEVRKQIQIWSNQPRLNSPTREGIPKAAKAKIALPTGTLDTATLEASHTDSFDDSPSNPPAETVSSAAILSEVLTEQAVESARVAPDKIMTEQAIQSLQAIPLTMFPLEPCSNSHAGAPASRYSVPSKHSVVAIVLTVLLAFILAIGGLSYAYLHGAGKLLLH
jgi:PilZ domain